MLVGVYTNMIIQYIACVEYVKSRDKGVSATQGQTTMFFLEEEEGDGDVKQRYGEYKGDKYLRDKSECYVLVIYVRTMRTILQVNSTITD